MKKVISIAMAICMLAAVAMIPVNALWAPASASFTKTEDLYDNTSRTGLDAYKVATAPALDGVKDEAWNSALKFSSNAVTRDLASYTVSNVNTEYYLLWDETNLYIYEEVFNYKIVGNNLSAESGGAKNDSTNVEPWTTSKWTASLYNILVPGDVVKGTTAHFAVMSVPGVTESSEVGATAEGVVRVRKGVYNMTDFATKNNTDKSYLTYTATKDTGLKTYSQKTATGFTLETVVPWSFVDWSADDAFANLTDKTNKTFGIKLNSCNSGYHINMSMDKVGTVSVNADIVGYDPVTLLDAEKPETINVGTTPATIAPDTDYWIGANGQFVTKNPKNGGQTYEISTAAQLLGLSEVLEISGMSSADTPCATILGSTTYADKAYLTKGNTFVLTADIDLNEGIDWAAFNSAMADRTLGIARFSAIPTNIFKSLDAFYGTFDGRGHTISGIFNPSAHNPGITGTSVTADFGGLVGSLRGGAVKNVVIDNGYIGDKDSGGFGGVIGTIYATTYTVAENGTVDINVENVYVGKNYMVDAYLKPTAGCQEGGIICGNYANGGTTRTININLKNLIFNGNFAITNAHAYSGYVLGNWNTAVSGASFNLYMTDCIGISDDAIAAKQTTGKWATTATRCADVAKDAIVPMQCAPYWVATEDGIMTVQTADFLSKSYHQTNEAVAEEGVDNPRNLYSVRILAEVASKNWASVGFKVTIVDKTSNTTISKENVANTTVYTSVIAADKTATADDMSIVDGDYIAAITIAGFDAAHEYEVSYTVVYTDENGNVFESLSPKTFTPTAYVPAAQS